MQDFTGPPKPHARTPCARSPADNNCHAIDFVTSLQQWVPATYQVVERPYLPTVGMTAQIQIHRKFLHLGHQFGRVIEQDAGCVGRGAKI